MSNTNRRKTQPPETQVPTGYDNRGHRLFRATQTSKQELTPLLKFLRHTQGVVTVVTAIGIVYACNVESVYYVTGALITSTLAKLLKKVIREERPEGSAVTRTSGMPSTHSSTVTYMCTYLLVSPTRPSSWLISLTLVAFPPLVMWSRVALGVHTPRQVIVGGTLGVLTGFALSAKWNGHLPLSSAEIMSPLHQHPTVLRLDSWIASRRPW